jgi:hypothetical protein
MSALLRSRKGQVGAIALGSLIVTAAAWFLLVAPQRSKVAQLDAQVIASQTQLSQRRLALARPSATVKVNSSDLYRLSKALPDVSGMSEILLDVNRLAARNTLDFSSITPSAPVAGTGYMQQPLEVIVQGRFSNVSHFLGDLRSLVSVRKGQLDARGRLYSVSRVELNEPPDGKKFPFVQGKVTVNAYSFSAPAPTAVPTPSTTAADSSSSGTVAAGATP